ncbi:MAG: cobalamin biosynthesis protein [Alphaproteobacteria bacterium]|nr:cobalamin biosynthesis protein [Alphaproteobacteria bacterium]MDE2336552.1 cobalamin biosynthesis protein [Alphaproteobacteria bacterium]
MALLVLIFLILHFGIGLLLPYQPGFKPYLYHWVEEAGIEIDRRLNRPERPQSVRIVRGAAAGLVMGALAVAVGLLVRSTAHMVYGIPVQLLFLACCVNFMMPVKVARQVLKDIGDLPRAKAVLQPYLREPLEHADGHTVIRKTIEFIALSFNRFLLGPVFWLLAAGPVGLSLYVTYAALQDAFGLPDKRRKYFGQFVRGADTLMNIVPAAISVAFIAASGLFVRRVNPWRETVSVLRQSSASGLAYPNWLMSAMANGLGVMLGGAVRYNADYVDNGVWLGPQDASARLMPEDLQGGMRLQYIFLLCISVMISVFMISGL